MDFFEGYQALDESKKSFFAETIQKLQKQTFILRGEILNQSSEYRFIEKYEELIDNYLRISGWRLQLDRSSGIARLYHHERKGLVSFNKQESVLLCLLRLVYHERMKDINEASDVVVTMGELQERLLQLTPRAGEYLTKKALRPAFRKFERFQLVQLSLGKPEFKEDSEITLLSTLSAALPAQNIKNVYQRLESYISKENDDNSTEDIKNGEME